MFSYLSNARICVRDLSYTYKYTYLYISVPVYNRFWSRKANSQHIFDQDQFLMHYSFFSFYTIQNVHINIIYMMYVKYLCTEVPQSHVQNNTIIYVLLLYNNCIYARTQSVLIRRYNDIYQTKGSVSFFSSQEYTQNDPNKYRSIYVAHMQYIYLNSTQKGYKYVQVLKKIVYTHKRTCIFKNAGGNQNSYISMIMTYF